jgi:hypothetical protein
VRNKEPIMKPTHFLVICAMVLAGVALAAPSTQPATRPATLPADQMLTRLLRPGAPTAQPLQPVENPPALDQTTGKPVAPNFPMNALIREGDYLPDRVGRMTKTQDGQFEFTFDSDGKSLQDPPVIILPNLKLMQMEKVTDASSRDLKFRISGIVTEYKGRNYILIDKVVVPPNTTQQF